MKEIIRLQHVDKVYPPKQDALRDIDFGVKSGEFLFVAGASGAGKSTLLKLLFAEERSSRGQIFIGGKDITSVSNRAISNLRKNIGIIFQDYKLIPTRSVIDNVAFALEVFGVRKRARMQAAFELLSALGLKDRIHAYPKQLSGGEQQRVSIARALISKPALVFADEPTGNLDPDMAVAVFKLLLEANRCGATVLIATHNLAMIQELNKRTIVLEKGRLVGDIESPRERGGTII